MRKTIIFLITILSILLIGYIFKEEIIFFDIGDTYYVISYFTITLYLVYLTYVVLILRFILKKIRNK